MKTYFTFIKHLQTIMLTLSIVILSTLPSALILVPERFTDTTYLWLYGVAHLTLFLVMLIRPLADIFRGVVWIRPLVILRKGFGVFSASIVVSFLIAKIITNDSGYFSIYLTPAYWSLENLALLAHLADLSAILLLITSNNLSKLLLGRNWKRIQRLSYVYFYGSALYVFLILNETIPLYYLIIVTIVTYLAWLRNHAVILQTNSPKITINNETN